MFVYRSTLGDTPKRSGTAAPAATAASSSSSNFSYASRLAHSTVETTTSMTIDSFLNNFKGYGNQDFEFQLRRVDDLVEEERRLRGKRLLRNRGMLSSLATRWLS